MTTFERATLEAWDDAHVWHPFTPHSVYRSEAPLMVVAAEGHQLIDVDGRRYLDGVGSLWCNILGHRREELDDAVREQLGRVAHATFLGNASVPGVVLAKRQPSSCVVPSSCRVPGPRDSCGSDGVGSHENGLSLRSVGAESTGHDCNL